MNNNREKREETSNLFDIYFEANQKEKARIKVNATQVDGENILAD